MNPNYQPLVEVRQTLRVKWYRCPIEPTKLRELMKRSDLQGWFQAAGHIWPCLPALASWVTSSGRGRCGSDSPPCCSPTERSAVSSRGVAPHELGHGTVFRTKWLNKLFLYLYSLLRLMGPLWLRHEPYLSPPLYPASRRGSRGAA